MLTAEHKGKVIGEHKRHEKDTGSSEVQVGLVSHEIDRLLSHLKKHPNDAHSRRGLLTMVSQRRKLLAYLARTDESRKQQLVKKLGLK